MIRQTCPVRMGGQGKAGAALAAGRQEANDLGPRWA
jgi:hypothetical protein